jgi:hypothetical protein
MSSTESKKNFWAQYLTDITEIIITTDLETDDLVALQMLAKLIPTNVHIIFVVGEGNGTMKYHRMKEYIELFGFNGKCTVYQGYDSRSDFKFDGEDVFHKITCEELRKKPRPTDNEELLKFIQSHKNTPIIMLKPPREFIEFWNKDNSLFNETVLIGYMSFNLSVLFEKWTKTQIISFLRSFKTVIYYETFFANGEDNCIEHNTNFPFDKLPVCTHNLMHLWNTDIYQKFSSKEKPTPKQLKIMKSIKENNNIQFVNADCGLIASLLLDLSETDFFVGDIDFNEFSVPIKNPNGKIIFISPSDKKLFRERQLNFYNKFF